MFFKQTHFLLALATPIVRAWPSQSFRTVPFSPPTYNVTQSGSPLADGLLFLTPVDSTSSLAVITKNSGELVWGASGDFNNLRVQTVDGQPALTYWNGTGSPNVATQGHGYGAVSILDTEYNVLYTICPNLNLTLATGPAPECQADIHESYVTERNTLLVTAYNATQTDLTAVGGASDGWVYNSLFFEIDIHTQEVLMSWSALEHVNISDSKQPLVDPSLGTSGTPESPWDFFHINSVQSVGNGYLVNSRMFWTTYMLDHHGSIDWRLEGSTGGNFTLPRRNLFAWEHDVRAHSVTSDSLILSMFNNNNTVPPSTTNQTSGLYLKLDLQNYTASLATELTDPTQPLFVPSQGALKPLDNGNSFMGYGALPIMKEYTPAGAVALSIQFGDLTGDVAQSYRAYRYPWQAIPTTAPIAVVDNGTVYMSWNGATNVTAWEIYEGVEEDSLVQTSKVPNMGFETDAMLKNKTKFVKVAADTGSSRRNSSVVSV